MSQVDVNPLGDPQREKSGSSTFEKYEYQYHWALCRIIEAQEAGGEYALFMEFHEDVTVTDSLDPESAKFELNQVKNISGKPLSVNAVTKIPKDESSSILGKMLSHYNQLIYKDRVSALNLVATCGFDFTLKQKGLSLQIIRQENLESESLTTVLEKLKKELSLESIPVCLQFVVPDLTAQGFQDATIGRVARFLESKFPGSRSNPVIIYRTLMDDLRIKGENRFDYLKWNEVLQGKAITSSTVTKIIQSYTSIGMGDSLKEVVKEIILDLSLSLPVRLQVSSRCNDLYIEFLGNPVSDIAKDLSRIQQKIINMTKEGKQLSAIVEECRSGVSSTDQITNLATCILAYATVDWK